MCVKNGVKKKKEKILFIINLGYLLLSRIIIILSIIIISQKE